MQFKMHGSMLLRDPSTIAFCSRCENVRVGTVGMTWSDQMHATRHGLIDSWGSLLPHVGFGHLVILITLSYVYVSYSDLGIFPILECNVDLQKSM